MIKTGKQINLRQWQLSDLEPFAYWNQPQHKWHQFNGPYFKKQTPEEFAKSLATKRRYIEANDHTDRQIAIADAHTDALLGSVSWYWQSEETNWLSIGIAVYDDSYWGKGIGYEALGLWSEHLFETMPQLVRLGLGTWSGNVGMMKLAEKVGYQEEARHRMARIVNGEYYDSMGYGILRTEWDALYPNGFSAAVGTTSTKNP